jgi:hypothetical protein
MFCQQVTHGGTPGRLCVVFYGHLLRKKGSLRKVWPIFVAYGFLSSRTRSLPPPVGSDCRSGPGLCLRGILLDSQKTVSMIVAIAENGSQIIWCDPYMTFVAPDGLSKRHGNLLLFTYVVADSVLLNG